jgi:hypothetical protein
MKLSIKDRLTLIGLLPQEGTLTEMVEIYDLVRELKLSDEEREEVNYVEDGPAIKIILTFLFSEIDHAVCNN